MPPFSFVVCVDSPAYKALGTIELVQDLQVAYECLQRAINVVKPGTRYRDLGGVISAHAETHGFSVVRTYCGHGIGEHFHCAPNVPHFAGNKAKGVMQVLFTNDGSAHDLALGTLIFSAHLIMSLFVAAVQ